MTDSRTTLTSASASLTSRSTRSFTSARSARSASSPRKPLYEPKLFKKCFLQIEIKNNEIYVVKYVRFNNV